MPCIPGTPLNTNTFTRPKKHKAKVLLDEDGDPPGVEEIVLPPEISNTKEDDDLDGEVERATAEDGDHKLLTDVTDVHVLARMQEESRSLYMVKNCDEHQLPCVYVCAHMHRCVVAHMFVYTHV